MPAFVERRRRSQPGGGFRFLGKGGLRARWAPLRFTERIVREGQEAVIFVPKDIERILEELETETDRSVAIVGASLIDESLQSAIASMLRPVEDDKDILDRLYGQQGIFTSVDAKILAAYALRIIGANSRRDLTLINKIRNQFAHDMNPLSFDDGHIRDQCKLLSVPQNSLAQGEPRREYLVSVRYYSAALDLYSSKELMEEDDRFELLLQLGC